MVISVLDLVCLGRGVRKEVWYLTPAPSLSTEDDQNQNNQFVLYPK